MGKNIGMWADAELEEKIVKRCRAEKISASEFLRRAVEKYLEEGGDEKWKRGDEVILKQVLALRGFVIPMAKKLYSEEMVNEMKSGVDEAAGRMAEKLLREG